MGIKFETHTTNKQPSSLKELLSRDILLFGKPFSDKKKEAFYNELSILLKSGINLKNSLELIGESQSKSRDQNLIENINRQIVAGNSFHTVLEKNKNFTSYEYHAVKIGEQTGQLAKVTEDLFNFFKQKNEQKRQVYSALSYPVIVLLTAVIVVYIMMRFVVPLFVDIFNQNNVELPWITQVIVSFSEFIGTYGWIFILIIFLLPFLYEYLKKQLWFKKLSGKIWLKIPILGPYLKKVYLTQFVQTMSLLSNAKVPVVSGLSLVREMISFYPLQESLHRIEKDIIYGQKLSESFAKYSLYDSKMIALLKVAEETNQTEYIFEKLHEQYRGDLKYRSQLITTLLNPIFTILIALIVGVILVAMYLPMFKLSSIIG